MLRRCNQPLQFVRQCKDTNNKALTDVRARIRLLRGDMLTGKADKLTASISLINLKQQLMELKQC